MKRSLPRIWMPEDVQFVKSNFLNMSNSEIAEKLNKRTRQVENIMSRLKLSRPNTSAFIFKNKKKPELSWDDKQRLERDAKFEVLKKMVRLNLKHNDKDNSYGGILNELIKINPSFCLSGFNELQARQYIQDKLSQKRTCFNHSK